MSQRYFFLLFSILYSTNHFLHKIRPGLSYREANRAALFSASNPSSERSSPALPTHYPRDLSGYAANRTAEDLEGQNEEHLGQLSEKVKLLKNVSLLLFFFG